MGASQTPGSGLIQDSASTQTSAPRMTYLIHYPRDFANEYDIFVGTKAEIDRLYALLNRSTERGSQLRRISRREAIQLGWSRVREAQRDGEQWYGGFAAYGREPYAHSVQAAILSARESTLELIGRGAR